MSRDMLIGCFETSLFFELVSLGHSAFSVSGSGSGFRAAGLAVFVGVDGEFAKEFSVLCLDLFLRLRLAMLSNGFSVRGETRGLSVIGRGAPERRRQARIPCRR